MGRVTYDGGTYPKLSDWEIREVQRRAHEIMAEHPPRRGRWRDGRYSRLEFLASEYGITRRTLYRYLRRAA